MSRFTRLEIVVVMLSLLLGVLGYLLRSGTLEFFAVITGAFAAALVVARALLSS
jgi:hypothetical protein